MGEKGRQLRLRHFPRMTLIVITNKANDPIAITMLRPQAIMLQAHHVAHLIEQLFGLVGNWGTGQSGEHEARYKGPPPRKQADYTDFICL